MTYWAHRLLARLSRKPVDASRWIVVDLETSGFDPKRDHVLAIGAVALREARVVVQDSFEMLLRPPAASGRENILVHGIGAEAQLAASEPREACERFRRYVGNSPLAAFHAPFDRGFLARAMKSAGRAELANPWLDVADLAPAVFPSTRAQGLDEWLELFGITLDRRHHAASDAFATAMLFARLLDRVPPAERSVAGLQALAQRTRNARAGH